MAEGLNKPIVKTYFITKNGSVHYGVVDTNQVMDSGLPNQEEFTDKDAWLTRLGVLGISNQDLIDKGFIEA